MKDSSSLKNERVLWAKDKTNEFLTTVDWNGLHSCVQSVMRVTTATTAGSRECTQCTLVPHQGYDTAATSNLLSLWTKLSFLTETSCKERKNFLEEKNS